MLFGYYLDDPSQARDPQKTFAMTVQEAITFNPATKTIPAFEQIEAKYILSRIYRQFPVLSSSESGWGIRYTRGLDMTAKADKLRSAEELAEIIGGSPTSSLQLGSTPQFIPLHEGKLLQIFDHRFASFEGIPASQRFGVKAATQTPSIVQKQNPYYSVTPRYWICRKDWEEDVAVRRVDSRWAIAFRHTTNVISNMRTCVAAICGSVAFNYQAPNLALDVDDVARASLLFVSMMNSYVFDYVVRQKFFGANLIKSILYQIAAPSRKHLESHEKFICDRAIELTYTSWDLEALSTDYGLSSPPFKWNEERRFLLRCELDAAFFHVYFATDGSGGWRKIDYEQGEDSVELHRSFPKPRDAIAFIMDTFPIIRRKDEEKFGGEYRTKQFILEIYDEMAEAIRTGKPYQTHLDPPPGDPRCCHAKR